MIPAAFDYSAPSSLDEALALLATHGDDAKILTGGQSLIPLLKLRLSRPAHVIDLRRLKELHAIVKDGATLVVGAGATHAAIAASELVKAQAPLLSKTAAEIGDQQIRNLGTIGGSAAHADPAADWPAALVALDATFVVRSRGGGRSIAASDFFLGALQSALQAGDILASIRFPLPASPTACAYLKMAQSASGFALAGVAVQLAMNGTKIAKAAIGITGVGERAFRASKAEALLAGTSGDPASLAAAAAMAADGVSAASDLHASADYRLHLARVLTRRALEAALRTPAR